MKKTNLETGRVPQVDTRRRWWQLWKPKYVWTQTKGEMLSENTIATPKGKIVKAQPAKFTPNNNRQGGRVVKAMPKDLRRMKEAQERPIETVPQLPQE